MFCTIKVSGRHRQVQDCIFISPDDALIEGNIYIYKVRDYLIIYSVKLKRVSIVLYISSIYF